MCRLLSVVVPLLVVAVVCLPPRQAAGCAIAERDDGGERKEQGPRTKMYTETALIVYDSAAGIEHFIRTADFQSSSSDFGFLVPTPGKPELAESSAEVFAALADITKPRTEIRFHSIERWMPKDIIRKWFQKQNAKLADKETDEEPPGRVRVVEQKRVGGYDAAVLQASDPKLLRDWLTANGYAARPSLEEWFKPYTAGGWYISAFKIATDAATAGTASVSNAAVRISFPTDRPFYPYREPAEMQSQYGGRELGVFVLSSARVSGTIGAGQGARTWPGRTVWANKVSADRLSKIATAGKLPEGVGRREWHLTEFEDQSSPRPGTDELYFEPAAHQTPVERRPEEVW